MKRQQRIGLVLAPLVVLTAPAAWWLRGEDAPLAPLVYYAGVGVVATFGLMWWFGRELATQVGRRKGSMSSRRDLVRLKGLGMGPADDHYEQIYPELAEKIEIINEAIAREEDLVFFYDTDGKGHERRVQPSYLHEYKSSRGGKVALCVNAYYFKRQSNVNFSVKRMSAIRIETVEG